MQIVVNPSGAAALVDPNNFKQFSVAAPAGDANQLAELVARAGIGRIDPDGAHVQVAPSAVRKLAEEFTGPTWNSGFEAMIAYARTKGWVNDADGSIRAHIERAG